VYDLGMNDLGMDDGPARSWRLLRVAD